MLAKNFENERPDYEHYVILIDNEGSVSQGRRIRTDHQGEIYQGMHWMKETNEKDLLGWLPVPDGIEEEWPKQG